MLERQYQIFYAFAGYFICVICGYYIDKIIETGIIPKTLTVKTVDDVIKEQEALKPHCPTCGSTDIQKISGTKRWLSTGLFGLASSDIGKSMCCKKCGYKW